jgi:hypothetical protein
MDDMIETVEKDDSIRSTVGKTINGMIERIEEDNPTIPEMSADDKEYDDYLDYILKPEVQVMMRNILEVPYYNKNTTTTPVQQFERDVEAMRNSTIYSPETDEKKMASKKEVH